MMLRRLFILLVVLNLPPAPGMAQVTPDTTRLEVELRTAGAFSAARLLDDAGLRRWHPIAAGQLPQTLQNVLEALRGRGYLFAAIDSIVATANVGQSRRHVVHVNEGELWRLQVSGSPPAEEGQAAVWREFASHPAPVEQFVENTGRLLREFARRGYPLATLTFDSVTLDGQEALAFLHSRLAAGPAVTIDSIIVRGNHLTKRNVITRELSFSAGDIFQLDKVESTPARLMRLGFFRRVAPPQLARSTGGRYVLGLEVVEGNSNTLNGVAGYNPGRGNERGYLTGLIDLNFGNLFGTGRQLGARWEKRGRDTQELALRYREPWILGHPLHLSGGFRQLIQDTIYVERLIELAAEWPASARVTVSGRLSRQSISPDSLAGVQLSIPNSRVLGVALGFAYNSLDDALNPRRGVAYQTTVETGRKRLASRYDLLTQGVVPGRSIHRQRLTVDFQLVVPTLRTQALSIAWHGRQVTSGEEFVSITDEYRLGGATTLRGYREEQFRGSRLGWSNIEYRYLLGPRSRAFVFVDLGYFFRESALAAVEEFKSAYGIGTRVETPLGIIGVDYGLGEGDRLLAGKVHVSLVNSF